jgi:hypothetical protein
MHPACLAARGQRQVCLKHLDRQIRVGRDGILGFPAEHRLRQRPRLTAQNAEGKALDPVRIVTLSIPAKKKGSETRGTMLFRIYSSSAGGVPGPYGVSVHASANMERKVRIDPAGTATVEESWELQSQDGDSIQFQIQYIRGASTHDKAQCRHRPRHRAMHEAKSPSGWLKFLRTIDRNTPLGLDLHLIADNYATHKHAKVKAWLKRHPRFHMHFTPTSASWLNQVERFFGRITADRIRRGVFVLAASKSGLFAIVANGEAWIGSANLAMPQHHAGRVPIACK